MDDIKMIVSNLKPEFDFDNSKDFVEDGYLDSLDIVTLVSELENSFGILIDALDILPENFESFEAIAKLVEKSGGTLA